MLEIKAIETYYGNIQALKGITISVNEGEIITLIGANGAGKSTTLMSSGKARTRLSPSEYPRSPRDGGSFPN